MSNGMDEITENSVPDAVVAVLADVLGLSGDAHYLTSASALFGSVPELDSLAVMEVVAALEERFGIEFEDDDVSMDVFSTVGALADLVERKQSDF